MSKFNVQKATNDCIKWIQDWFEKNGKDCNAIIGISGGKDSSVVAALCVQALGKERIIGVMMPKNIQSDIDCAIQLCSFLKIENITINIHEPVEAILNTIKDKVDISRQTVINLPARIRMVTLYAIAQSRNGRVANTCNMSEDWVGYSTKFGDAAGDFSPISNFTVTEVKQIGAFLGLPHNLIHKTPIDGLSGKTDEENLGFTYDTLDKYIRDGIIPDAKTKESIDNLHEKNLFKLQLMPSFPYKPE